MREEFCYFRSERILEAEVLDTPIHRRADLLRAMQAEPTRYEEMK